jgi:hypothetical protein
LTFKNPGNKARKSLADGGDLLLRNLVGGRQMVHGIFKSDNYRIELTAFLEVKFTLIMGGRGNGMDEQCREQKL